MSRGIEHRLTATVCLILSMCAAAPICYAGLGNDDGWAGGSLPAAPPTPSSSGGGNSGDSDRTANRAEARDNARWQQYSDTFDEARAAETEGDLARAEALFRRAQDECPTNDESSFLHLGFILTREGKYDEAEAALGQARKYGISKAHWRRGMAFMLETKGNALMEAGDYSGAEVTIRMALDYGADKGWVFNELGVICERQGRLSDAASLYSKAAKQDRKEPLYADNLKGINGRIAYLKRKDEDAKAAEAIAASIRTFDAVPSRAARAQGEALTGLGRGVGLSPVDAVATGAFGTPVAHPVLEFTDPDAGDGGKDFNASRQLNAISTNDRPLSGTGVAPAADSRRAELGFDTSLKSAGELRAATLQPPPAQEERLVIPERMRDDVDVKKLDAYRQQEQQARAAADVAQAKFLALKQMDPHAEQLGVLQEKAKEAQDKAGNLANMVKFQAAEVKRKISFAAFDTAPTVDSTPKSPPPPTVTAAPSGGNSKD